MHAGPHNPESFPFVVLGNKADLATTRRQVSQAQVKKFCESNGNVPHFETSASSALNVEQAFYTIAKNALAQDSVRKPIYIPDTLDLKPSNPPASSSSGCCS